jgi:hypothetical protein
VNVCAKLFSTNKERFYEASETLLEHLHFKIEETHKEIAVTGFKAFVTVDLLDVLDVLDICLLTFDLVTGSITESIHLKSTKVGPIRPLYPVACLLLVMADDLSSFATVLLSALSLLTSVISFLMSATLIFISSRYFSL